MKIDKEKLIDMLVDKTGMEKEAVENQLGQLISRITDAAERGKALEIKGFGLFYFDETNQLTFDASDELSTEISFKYAGMKPIELSPERDTSFIVDEDSVTEKKSEDDKVPDKESVFDPFDPLKQDGPEDPPETDKTEIASEPEQPNDAKKEVLPKKEKSGAQKKAQKKSSNTINVMMITIAAIMLIAVLIGGYFYYTESVDSMTETGTQPSTEEQQLEPAPEETPEIAENPEVIPDMEQIDPNAVTEEPAEEEPIPQEQSTYGLMGDVIDEANDGYSIVIHSFNDEENARSTAAGLNGDGYRVLVSSRSVSADTVWRVSIGQFQTLQNAVEAAGELPSPYNTQNFIQRIQIN